MINRSKPAAELVRVVNTKGPFFVVFSTAGELQLAVDAQTRVGLGVTHAQLADALDRLLEPAIDDWERDPLRHLRPKPVLWRDRRRDPGIPVPKLGSR